MTLPRHRSVPKEFQGHAPYNFVPLPESVFVPRDEKPFAAHDRLDPTRLHGWVDLTITTETELYTRCAYPTDKEALDPRDCDERADFYHHGDPARPVIPGSSLRGMVRSLVEILAHARITRRARPGKATRVRDRRLVYRAVADDATSAGKAYKRFVSTRPQDRDADPDLILGGWLEIDATSGDWRIWPSQRVKGLADYGYHRESVGARGIPNHQLGSNPRPRCSPRVLVHGATTFNGVVVPTGPVVGGRRQKVAVVLEPEPTAQALDVSSEVRTAFLDDNRMTRGIKCRLVDEKSPTNSYLLGERTRDVQPVFYATKRTVNGIDEVAFLGPTLYFRTPYERYTADYLPQADLHPGKPLDLAEALFGTVNDGERTKDTPYRGAHRGRVTFDDAECVVRGGPVFLDEFPGGRCYPPVLASPKPTSFQNYLVQDIEESSYDAARREREQLLAQNRSDRRSRDQFRPLKAALRSYADDPPDGTGDRRTALRGFKRFWHRSTDPTDLARSWEDHARDSEVTEKQFTRIRPVARKTSFAGRVRFENLTELELGALLAALELPKECRHQLGMAKPYGLGTVAIKATAKLFDPRRHYSGLALASQRPDTSQVLQRCREKFRAEIVAHHNHTALPGLSPAADFWLIPRLRDLRDMANWEQRPARDETAYATICDEAGGGAAAAAADVFKSRLVLPPPSDIAKRLMPGSVVQYGDQLTRLRLDGVPGVVRAAQGCFPPALWGRYPNRELKPGRRVLIEMNGDNVVRVEPAPQ